MTEPSSVESIFLAAVQKESSEERARYLDEACGGDADLRGRVERLLNAHPKVGNFLESPAAPALATIDEPITEQPGTVLGPYKLLEQIGEGGFGVVFMAEQTQPVRRRVALKVLKPGMDTRQVVARFEAERSRRAGTGDHGSSQHRPRVRRRHDGQAPHPNPLPASGERG